MLLTISNVVFSAYCACKICCGDMASGITSAGTRPSPEKTIAGPRIYPLGTSIQIGYRIGTREIRATKTIEDRTARKWDGKRWDIYFKDHEAARQFGLRTGTVTIVRFPKPTKLKK